MHWHSISAAEALESLRTGPEGLSRLEVEQRRKTHGWNELPETGKRKWFWMLVNQFRSLLVLILLIAAGISWFTGHFVDVYVILAVVAINALIGFVQEYRAEEAVASLKSMLTPFAKTIREGKKRTIPARELVPGDLIVLEAGDSIPADARLTETRNLRTIESALTGESVPVSKHTDPLPETALLADRRNMVLKNTFVAGGYAQAVVTGTGLNTAIGEIARTLSSIKTEKTNFQKKTDVLARQMGILSVLSAALLFAVAYFHHESTIDQILIISIAALVSAIPEGLPAVLAIVLAIGANRMARRNAIIREFTATETLGAVTTIITDKTGTLTQNTLTVRKIGLPGEPAYQVTGEGWSPTGNFLRDSLAIDPGEHPVLQQLLRICAWSNNAEIHHDEENDTYHLTGDPTEGALLALARKGGFFPKKDPTVRKIDDLPFNSALKMRAALTEEHGKKQLLVIGAPEQILERSSHILLRQGPAPMEDALEADIRRQIESWSGTAMRVIALAYRDEPDALQEIGKHPLDQLTLAGIAGMIDPPRPDVKDAVGLCGQAGIRVIMATGDHIQTAIAVARATGIIPQETDSTTLALTEAQLLALDEKEFESAVLETNVFARLTPNMKLRIADTLQRKGELIAMTGDGVNDAPALKKADVGVAMGIMGTDVARDAAKVVLADDNFSTIIKAVEEGRIVFTNARQTSFFLLTTNFAEIITLISAILMGLPIPLTATQILWLNLVTDGLGDLALATERGHGDVLRQKPVNPREQILHKSVVPFLLINAVLMTVLAIGAFRYFLPESLDKARTAAFIIMAMSQLFNVYNMRALKYSIFRIGIFSNKYVNWAIAVSILIQVAIIEIPFFQHLFSFDAIAFLEFIALSALASLVVWVGEIYKFAVLRSN